LYEDGYDTATEQVSPVYWTQADNLSGIGSTTVEVDTSAEKNNGSWVTVGSSSAPGDVTVSWDTGDLPGGLYAFRATTCDQAGNCAHYPWQGQVARVRTRHHPCASGVIEYCYVSRSAGNGLSWASFGTKANIYTPGTIRPQNDLCCQHTAIYVNLGGAPWLQTGLTTDCGANMQGGYDYAGDLDNKDYWGTYVEYFPPHGHRHFQCFGKQGVPGQPGYAAEGYVPPVGSYQNYAVDVLGSGTRARAYIGNTPQVIQEDTSRRDQQTYRTRGYLLGRDGELQTHASGETTNHERQLAGSFASWLIGYTPSTWSAPRSIQDDISDGYRLNAASSTRWCVTDAHRGCSPP
jgi:hypothetical protein